MRGGHVGRNWSWVEWATLSMGWMDSRWERLWPSMEEVVAMLEPLCFSTRSLSFQKPQQRIVSKSRMSSARVRDVVVSHDTRNSVLGGGVVRGVSEQFTSSGIN